jgi:hypothetical protein
MAAIQSKPTFLRKRDQEAISFGCDGGTMLRHLHPKTHSGT